jgi:hypothetical protein
MEITPETLAGFEHGAGVNGPFGHIIQLPAEYNHVSRKP